MMRNYLSRLLIALLGQSWRMDAFFYFKGKGYADKIALDKVAEMRISDWKEIVKKQV